MATKRKKPACLFSKRKLESKRCKKTKNGVWLCCTKKKTTKRRRRRAA